MEFEYKGKTIEILQGDITKVAVDAIVNAANEGLRGGGGVDGAIHRAGGPVIMEESRKIGYCATGSAVITTGGRLPARHVIHTVGPVWHGGKRQEPELLRSAYDRSLKLANEHRLTSIAFPSISTGLYGYPIGKAGSIAIGATLDHLDGPTTIEKAVFILFSAGDYEVYVSRMKEMLAERG
jgi:O-acetyl-ADP-ribose deacetylase (regulator of RNase III)